MSPSPKQYWYEKRKLKHVTGFVTYQTKLKLRELAKASDISLAKYVSRLLTKHANDVVPPKYED